MDQKAAEKPKGRGRPKRQIFDPAFVPGLSGLPTDAESFFAIGDRIAALRSEGFAAEDIALHFGVSPATVSRWVRGARWPKNVRARILLKAEAFPVPVLMRLARTTFKDQGSQTASDGRKGPKSRLTLLGAVLRITEGKALPKVSENVRARAERLERALIDERGRRQALSEECRALKEEKQKLEEQFSGDVLSRALRRNHELESELERLRLVPGAAPNRPKKSADLERSDEQLASVLGCRVDTLDWSRGLLLIKAGNGDILDGVRERIILGARRL